MLWLVSWLALPVHLIPVLPKGCPNGGEGCEVLGWLQLPHVDTSAMSPVDLAFLSHQLSYKQTSTTHHRVGAAIWGPTKPTRSSIAAKVTELGLGWEKVEMSFPVLLTMT